MPSNQPSKHKETDGGGRHIDNPSTAITAKTEALGIRWLILHIIILLYYSL